MRKLTLHSVFLGGSVLAVGSAQAADPVPPPPDTSTWVCKSCPFEHGYRADVVSGAAYVSDDAAKFGDARGLSDAGGKLIAAASGRYAGEGGRHLDYALDDLGLNVRSALVEGGQQGSFDLYALYKELPHNLFDTTQTVFTGVGGSQLQLPPSWVRAGSTAGMATLPSALYGVDIESKRKTFGVGGRYLFSPHLDISVDYRREKRDGLSLQSASFGTLANELPLAIDSTTDEATLTLRYRAERGDVALAYSASIYDDANLGRTWANPFAAFAPGADAGRLAAPPDNDYQQLRLSGSYLLPLKTVIAASGSVGKMRQDETFLPYTIDSQLSTSPLPRNSLDGKVDTKDLQLAVTSRPIARTRLKVAYHYDQRDNTTAQATWNIVEGDVFPAGTFVNIPYGFTRERLNLSAEYELLRSLRVSGGYDRTETRRPFQEVRDQAEDTGWGQVRWQPVAFLDVTAKGGASYRNIGSYDTSVAISNGENPLLRKYNLADRDREFAELSAAFTLPRWPVSIGLTASGANDAYRRSVVGLTNSHERRMDVDVSWSPREQLSVFLRGGYERVDSDQVGSESFAVVDWFARNADRFRSAGGGLQWSGMGRFDLTLDYIHSRGTGDIAIRRLGSLPDGLPQLETTLDSALLNVKYHWSAAVELAYGVRYESFHSHDWALAGLEPATVPTLLSMGADPYNYDVMVFSLSFRYSFEPSRR